jgi:hypothetical protein
MDIASESESSSSRYLAILRSLRMSWKRRKGSGDHDLTLGCVFIFPENILRVSDSVKYTIRTQPGKTASLDPLNADEIRKAWCPDTSVLAYGVLEVADPDPEEVKPFQKSVPELFRELEGLPPVRELVHRIDTGESPPIKSRPYKVYSPEQRDYINAFVEENLEKQLIRRSNSPWSPPLLLVAGCTMSHPRRELPGGGRTPRHARCNLNNLLEDPQYIRVRAPHLATFFAIL